MLQLTSELTDTGYNLPVADYLRRVRAMFIVHNATNNQLQIAYSAYHAKATSHIPSTGEGLLKHMVKLEADVRAQGGVIFVTGLLDFAAKAAHVVAPKSARRPPSASSATPATGEIQALLMNMSLTALQKEVLNQHLQAAVTAVKFAGAHPTDYKLRAHFCPVHGFNEVHSESDCLRCKEMEK